ncbi:MAG: hypothetical protein IV093_21670 [Rubrivivax sp.]|nr:hypothetical protein [Rubrivivax sp.]
MTERHRPSHAAVLLAALALAACSPPGAGGSGGGGGSSGTPAQVPNACDPYGFKPTLPWATPVNLSLPDASRGPLCFSAQNVTGAFSTAVDIEGFADEWGNCTRNMVYRFAFRSVNPVTGACVGPSSPEVVVRMKIDHAGAANTGRPNPMCIVSSRIDFEAFEVTGTPLDDRLQKEARGQVHRAMDRELAMRMTTLFRANAAQGVSADSGRCAGWYSLEPKPSGP